MNPSCTFRIRGQTVLLFRVSILFYTCTPISFGLLWESTLDLCFLNSWLVSLDSPVRHFVAAATLWQVLESFVQKFCVSELFWNQKNITIAKLFAIWRFILRGALKTYMDFFNKVWVYFNNFTLVFIISISYAKLCFVHILRQKYFCLGQKKMSRTKSYCLSKIFVRDDKYILTKEIMILSRTKVILSLHMDGTLVNFIHL